MGRARIAIDEPLPVGQRLGWETVHVVLDVKNIHLEADVLEFEAEDPIGLAAGKDPKEVYFLADKHGEDELVFFGLQLKSNHIHLLPGNSKISAVWIDNGFSCVSAENVQRKHRNKGAAHA